MIRTLIFVFALGLIVASACMGVAVSMGHFGWHSFDKWGGSHMSFSDGDDERGGGPQVTRDVPWSGGDSLTFDVPGTVHYTQGPTVKFSVTGPENVVKRIVVDGDTVHAEHWNWWHDGRLDFVVTAPDVAAFTLNGSQNLSIADFNHDRLKVEINGSGDVDAKGTARSVTIEIRGNGDVDMGGIAAEDAKVEIAGSGDAKIAPTKSADIEIAGSGDVTLLTDPPSVKTEIAGSGKIHKETAAPTPAVSP